MAMVLLSVTKHPSAFCFAVLRLFFLSFLSLVPEYLFEENPV